MAIVRKPSGDSARTDIDALIDKGGSPANEKRGRKGKGSEAGVEPVILRIPSGMLAKIDDMVEARPIRTPRHTWLLEAVFEKLEREMK
jgi:hypothetical protein